MNEDFHEAMAKHRRFNAVMNVVGAVVNFAVIVVLVIKFWLY